jgi:hypothetical protein
MTAREHQGACSSAAAHPTLGRVIGASRSRQGRGTRWCGTWSAVVSPVRCTRSTRTPRRSGAAYPSVRDVPGRSTSPGGSARRSRGGCGARLRGARGEGLVLFVASWTALTERQGELVRTRGRTARAPWPNRLGIVNTDPRTPQRVDGAIARCQPAGFLPVRCSGTPSGCGGARSGPVDVRPCGNRAVSATTCSSNGGHRGRAALSSRWATTQFAPRSHGAAENRWSP